MTIEKYSIMICIALFVGASTGEGLCAQSGKNPTGLIIITSNSNEINGKDDGLGVNFKAQQRGEKVTIDAEFDKKGKVFHAEIDYQRKTLLVQSLASVNRQLVKVEPEDIVAFQALFVSVPQNIDTGSQISDALMSFLNLMASAPGGIVLDIH